MTAGGALFPGERIVAGPHHPVLCHHRPGDGARPLVILAPGGGHLGRVYYGHPGAEPRDFLCDWLERDGHELLALSYASDHPANPAPCQGMTILEWAADFAAAAARFAAPGRELLLVGWSMAGRLARPFRMAAMAHGLRCDRMISLAASAQLPKLTSATGPEERLTPDGFWDGEARGAPWRAAIDGLRQPCGRQPIAQADYARHYRCNNPVALRGEPRTQPPSMTLEALSSSLQGFDYAGYPLVGAVIPTRREDGRHAITDRMTWGFLNAQMLFCEADRRIEGGTRAMDEAAWETLRALAAHAGDQLSRSVDGDHFFFIGERGARAAAAAIGELLAAMEPVRVWRAALPEPKGPAS